MLYNVMWYHALLLVSLYKGALARPATNPTLTSGIHPYDTPSLSRFITRAHKDSDSTPTPTKQCYSKGCPVEQSPVWDPKLQECICEWDVTFDPTLPSLCADMMCIAEMEVKYDTETGQCGCVWIPGLEPSPVDISVRQAEPTFPPCEIRCRPGSHVVQSDVTGICACVRDSCEGIGCIAEMTPVWDSVSGRCKCQWIEGFGPPSSFLVEPPTSSPAPTASLVVGREVEMIRRETITGLPISQSCPHDIYCISEKRPRYDQATGKCICVWIPGLEPNPVVSIRELSPAPTDDPSPVLVPCEIRCRDGYH